MRPVMKRAKVIKPKTMKKVFTVTAYQPYDRTIDYSVSEDFYDSRQTNIPKVLKRSIPMNDILTDTAKSFRLMRPKTQSGTFKPMSTYTKKRDNILFLPIVDNKEDIVKALTTLLGPVGIKKSFFNYFFLKRYIWRSVLYPKPVVREYIDRWFDEIEELKDKREFFENL